MIEAATASPARARLRHHFGYDDFRPLQTRVVEALEQGRDVLAVLPTGAGKSICFQVPALLRTSPTIVISPLISLMQDQVAAAVARGIPAAALNSTLSAKAQRELLEQVVQGAVRLLYTSPERLGRLAVDLVERGFQPGLLAVDEAHCISEWGTDFRPAYRTLRRLRAKLGWPQVIALTGSATPAVRKDITFALGLGRGRGFSQVLGSFDRRNLWFGVAQVGSERERLRALISALTLQDALAIVYAPTRNLVEELSRVLGNSGFRAAPYHAGLSPAARRDVLNRFLTDQLGVVVATCAFGMGIDKPNVRLVVHWTLPPTPEAYYQEAGRAGRDGGMARCLLLHRAGDAGLPLRQLDVTFPPEALAERVWAGAMSPDRLPSNLRASIERLHRELRPGRVGVNWEPVRRRRRQAEGRIAVMERYAREHRCRRAALIEYFGERIVRCSGCDVCSGHAPARPLPRKDADRRLARLRSALSHLHSPWGGCPLEPQTLRRLSHNPPASEAELAAVEGVGRVIARRFGRTILVALSDPSD
jgi:RecQ family ATP-dependent DNA helicase